MSTFMKKILFVFALTLAMVGGLGGFGGAGQAWGAEVTYTGVVVLPADNAPTRLGGILGESPIYEISFPIGTEVGENILKICNAGDICTVTGDVKKLGGILMLSHVSKVSLALRREEYRRQPGEDEAQLLRRLRDIRVIAEDLMQ